MKVGYVAVIGRPNVGKSTLLNYLVGQKISITSRKPQTTRHSILGIKTNPSSQVIYVDTPGIHEHGGRALNRYLNRTAHSSMIGVDIIVWVIEGLNWEIVDLSILEKLKNIHTPVILVINKIDRIKNKQALLPFLQDAAIRYSFEELIPASALRTTNLNRLEDKILDLLPIGNPIFPIDQISDRPERFFAAEIVREKLIRCLGQELPHALTVAIERFEETDSMVKIDAMIWVERDSQKSIVIGNKGDVLKKVGQRARADLNNLLSKKVHLGLWVKVKKGWSDNERALQSLGFNELP